MGPFRTPAAEVVAAVALGAILFVPFLGSRDLWAPNEPNHAEVAREMVASGDYAVPRLMGEVYGGKPPLLHWGIALGLRALAGEDREEWAARLPSALAALLLLGVTARLGQVLFPGTRVGLLGALVLATSLRFFWQARWAEPDMLLAASVGLALLGWLRMGERPFRGLPPAALGIGGALLAKGPVAFVPLLAAAAAGEILLPARPRIRRPALFLVAIAAGVAIASAWLVVAIGRGYPLGGILREQVVGRAAEGLHHAQPWHYYLWNVPLDFFPWTFPLLAAILLPAEERGEARPRRFLLAVFVATAAAFSLSPEKRALYLLPVHPLGALLVGVLLCRDRAAGRPRWPVAAAWGLTAALLLLGAATLLAAASGSAPRIAPGFPEGLLSGLRLPLGLLALSLLLAAGGAAACLARRRAGLPALAAGAGIFLLLGSASLGRLDGMGKSARPFAERAAARAGVLPERPAPRLAVVGSKDPELAFYAAKHFGASLLLCPRPEDLLDFLRGPGPAFVLATDDPADRAAQDLAVQAATRLDLLLSSDQERLPLDTRRARFYRVGPAPSPSAP